MTVDDLRSRWNELDRLTGQLSIRAVGVAARKATWGTRRGKGPVNRKHIEEWLSLCEEHQDRLTKWEQGFIESVRYKVDQGGGLSDREVEILERIYAERTP